MPRAKQRTPALRDRVLHVALETPANDGIAGFTTRRVAGDADTSTNAVYELLGDKAGLVREAFFEEFRMLGRRLRDGDRGQNDDDPRAELIRTGYTLRRFVHENPVLADVMFSRPFADLDPGPAEQKAGAAVRNFVVDRVRRAVDAGVIAGDPIDIAHVMVALALGLAGAENASRLGRSKGSVDSRWALAFDAVLAGLSPDR